MPDSDDLHRPAPLPADEPERLRTLHLQRILDTAAEGAFDDLVRLAALVCETPIAAISLVDEHRQWFKAEVGLGIRSTPRDVAFCAHAVLGTDLLVVGDAAADPRFRHNPLVTDDPKIRFYAGAPIVLQNGIALGTVCVIDRKPRVLSGSQLEALQLLRQIAANLIELRRARLHVDAMAKLLPVCSWCHSVETASGAWVDLHRYVEASVPVTHGMCPTCMARELKQMQPRPPGR